MYETAKNLELVEVEAYGCCIFFSYLILHKTLILCNVISLSLSCFLPSPCSSLICF